MAICHSPTRLFVEIFMPHTATPSTPTSTPSTATSSAAPNAASEHTSAEISDDLLAEDERDLLAQPDLSAQTIVLDVGGMMCAGCVGTVEKTLAQCEGVKSATVNLVTEVAAVEYTTDVSPEAIAQTLTEAGYPSQIRRAEESEPLAAESAWLARKEDAQQQQTRQLITAFSLLILSTLGHLQHFQWAQGLSIPVISSLWFHGALATLTLLFPARQIIIEGVQGLRRGAPNMNTLVGLGALSAYSTSVVALLTPALGWACFFDEPVMLLSFILLGRTLEQRARFQAASSLRSLIALQPTFARLVTDPNAAKAETAGVQIPVGQVQVGDWLRVLPSEKVPMDGVIAMGQTTVDESMLSGESVPVVKQVGDEVVAGSLNQSGAITLQVVRTGRETALAQMIQLIETAQTRKAPIQGIADLIAGYFTYGVMICAALTFVFWYWVGVPLWPDAAQIAMVHAHHGLEHGLNHGLEHGLNQGMSAPMTQMPGGMGHESGSLHPDHLRLLASLKLAISVLVVACPCALGLATPTAILVGSGIGAKQGLLIRGGDILEAAQNLDTLVFDKTGTLTTGRPQLTDCVVLDSAFSRDQVLQLAATVESGTRHPLGLAIQQAATEANLSMLVAQDFCTEAGFGITASVVLKTAVIGEEFTEESAREESVTDVRVNCFVGNRVWMERHGCASDEADAHAQRLGEAGKTAVFVALGSANPAATETDSQRRIVGVLGIADTLRADAAETLSALRSLGIETRILSGDSEAAVAAIAASLDIDPQQVQAEVTPTEKLEAIQALQHSGRRVGLVGDGINDAPAIAQADVGIALNSGTDIAMETADIILMRSALTDVLAALRLSRLTVSKIRQNLAWAFAYNLVCIPLAAGALLPTFGLALNPGFAGGLMALSSVTVVANSLLLKREV